MTHLKIVIFSKKKKAIYLNQIHLVVNLNLKSKFEILFQVYIYI